MKPILIIKTKNGFAVMEFEGDIPPTSIDSLQVADSLGEAGGYAAPKGLHGIIERHFKAPPEPVVMEAPKIHSNAPLYVDTIRDTPAIAAPSDDDHPF